MSQSIVSYFCITIYIYFQVYLTQTIPYVKKLEILFSDMLQFRLNGCKFKHKNEGGGRGVM